jgi:hypothetical protein
MPCNGQVSDLGTRPTDRQGLYIAHMNVQHVLGMLGRRRNPKALSTTDQ